MKSQAAQSLPLYTIELPDAQATERLGRELAKQLQPGDCVLLSGQIGAGKSHLARAAIRTLLRESGEPEEDIPSPTYTLVQTYLAGGVEIWHADLYRLTDSSEVMELGLDEGFATGISFVEWPDRLGTEVPKSALSIQIEERGEGRRATFSGPSERWQTPLSALTSTMK